MKNKNNIKREIIKTKMQDTTYICYLKHIDFGVIYNNNNKI